MKWTQEHSSSTYLTPLSFHSSEVKATKWEPKGMLAQSLRKEWNPSLTILWHIWRTLTYSRDDKYQNRDRCHLVALNSSRLAITYSFLLTYSKEQNREGFERFLIIVQDYSLFGNQSHRTPLILPAQKLRPHGFMGQRETSHSTFPLASFVS